MSSCIILLFYRSFVSSFPHFSLTVWEQQCLTLMYVCVCASLEKHELGCKFCERIVLQVILEIDFTVKNFLWLHQFAMKGLCFILESLIKH